MSPQQYIKQCEIADTMNSSPSMTWYRRTAQKPAAAIP
jgi:hypothetical protein